jgi:Flp pilus assembly protein TadD
MSSYIQVLGAAAAVTVGLLVSAALHAQQSGRAQSNEEPMRPGTMNMMRQMGRMMDHCDKMMQRDAMRPNDQWRETAPPQSGQTEQKR